jgi:5'-3' exonuclease
MGRIKKMRTAGLIPVVVFDMLGSKSKDKEEENRRRLEKRTKAYDSYLRIDDEWDNMTEAEQAEVGDLKEKLLRASLTISSVLVWETIKELRYAGISYFVSPGEADHQLVHLAKTGLCKYVMTIDGDLLAHGVPVIRQYGYSSGTGTVYQLPATSDDFFLGGPRAAFAFAFFVGCDYTSGVFGIGPAKARSIIESCEGILDPEYVIHQMVEGHPKVTEARTTTVKGPDGEDVVTVVPAITYDEYVTSLADLYRAFECAVVYDPKEKRFVGLDGSTPAWEPAAHAQRYSLGMACADPLCSCHNNHDYHGVGPVTRVVQDGDLDPTLSTSISACCRPGRS